MLQKLQIKNYALIDHLEINFSDGFSVITGETGSGKSILLGALGLILGNRMENRNIRINETKCVVEGHFILDKKTFKNSFEIFNLDYEEETIIRREISKSGKSRAFVNDTPVSLSILKEISSALIDIHSQDQTRTINSKQFLFSILDNNKTSRKLLLSYQKLYNEYKVNLNVLENLKTQEIQANSELDYNKFLLSEFDHINLDVDFESIEAKLAVLENSEIIRGMLSKSEEIISAENGILDLLNTLDFTFSKNKDLDSRYQTIINKITTTLQSVEDINADILKLNQEVDIDPYEFEKLSEIQSKINSLIKKHNCINFRSLQEKKESIIQKINTIDTIGNQIAKITGSINKQKIELTAIADQLNAERNKTAPKIEKSCNSSLDKMKMKSAEIRFKIQRSTDFNQYGSDMITLTVKTNKGNNFEPLNKVGSGGEKSRIMLAIKTLMSNHKQLPTIIFDEIDTGVSGEVASTMGKIMSTLGQSMQVFSITHLPQIASQGDHHFKVWKEETMDNTKTHVSNLNQQNRITEIAEMLSGGRPSKEAKANATHLLHNL